MLSVLALIGAGPGAAQQSTEPTQTERARVISPVLTIDGDRLFRDSAFGRRAAEDRQRQREALASENRSIEAELTEEEVRLTELRATTGAEEFKAMADAFDEKVQQTKADQLAKERAVNETYEQQSDALLSAAAPVLNQLMQDAGAAVILDRRYVFVGVSVVDITDRAIEILDETIGAGAASDQ